MQSRLISAIYKNALHKDKTAIVSDNDGIRYGDLFNLALKYKLYFEQQKVKRICLISNRSIEFYAIVLGIVLSGGSYLLYETTDITPNVVKRIETINPDIILTEKEQKELSNAILLEDLALMDMGSIDFEARGDGDYLYYVTTSGTTGEGKIIGTKDENLLCYLDGYIKQFGMTHEDVFFQQSPVYYDGFAEEFFATLLVGGTMVFTQAGNLKSPIKILEQLNKHHVTVFPSTPLIIGEINRLKKPIGVKSIISSGDVLKSNQIDWLLNNTDIRIYNMYGLSESTVCATYHLCTKEEKGDLPIGNPLEGYEILLLDDNGNKVPTREIGEIYIGGKGVIEEYYGGYGGRENLVRINNATWLKTGDYAWHDDTEYHFAGRKDRIVKNKSNKINLNEIETVLLDNEEVKDIAVIFLAEKQWLYFFYVSDCLNEECFRELCKQKLNSYMMPNRVFRLDELPMSATGKIDYKYLSVLGNTEDSSDQKETGQDEANKVYKFVCDTLNDSRIDVTKTLEEIGVDSFTYISLLADLEEEFQIEVGEELLIMNEAMTIEDFCQIVNSYLEGK